MYMYVSNLFIFLFVCKRFEQEYKTYSESHVKKFELTRLPPYLILCVKVLYMYTVLAHRKSGNFHVHRILNL